MLASALVGAVAGWAVHPLLERMDQRPPLVTWPQPLALLLAAAILAYAARSTWQVVQVHRSRLPTHEAVNRLLLARACAIVGALAGGAYAGYALSWVGDPAELADERAFRSLVAAMAGGAIVAAAWWLERACRVPDDDDSPGPGSPGVA